MCYFNVPEQPQKEENGARWCLHCPGGHWASNQINQHSSWLVSVPVLTPCVTNSTGVAEYITKRAGKWSQSQLVPTSCLWHLQDVWPLINNLISISLSFLMWKMGRIVSILKMYQTNIIRTRTFYLLCPQFLSLLATADKGHIADLRTGNSLADKKPLVSYREFLLRRVEYWVPEVKGPGWMELEQLLGPKHKTEEQ